ncbi:hypothetical protein [Pedobacter kyungheensis]|nr:hypothetical protein [Pedobacter kyungheensis]
MPKDDYFIISHGENIIGATRQEGSDWILMQRDEIEEWRLVGCDNHPAQNSKPIILGAAEINQIAGEIENHMK